MDRTTSYINEAILIFRNLHLNVIANSLEVISRMFTLDQQLTNALQAESLVIFKEKILEACMEVTELFENLKEKDISSDVREVLLARVICYSTICEALEFKKPDPENLDNVREILERWGFEGFTTIDHLKEFISVINQSENLEKIPIDVESSLLGTLGNLSVLNGVLTGKISMKIGHYSSKLKTEMEYHTDKPKTREEEPKVLYHFIGDTQKDRVRVCLVQLDFHLEYTHPPKEFGYVLKEREIMKEKVFEALEIASANGVDMICFPELSTVEEWVQDAKEYKDMTIVFGTYYKNGFNTCPIIVDGQDYWIQKINPSPEFETETEKGREMKKGRRIFVFQTKSGRFTVLICMDYREEVHRILHNRDERIKNVDFIVVPQYNRNMELFQKQGDLDCRKGNCPYILQTNAMHVFDKKVGGTCIIGIEHRDALEKYKIELSKPKDAIEYKLVEIQEESMIIADLDLEREIIPASGPRRIMQGRYTYENGMWRLQPSKHL